MLYLDGIGISFLVKEIKEKILRYKLTKIFQYDRVSFSLFFGKNNLLFQVKDNSTIFYLKDEKELEKNIFGMPRNIIIYSKEKTFLIC